MFVAPAVLEARDALHNVRRTDSGVHARAPPPPVNNDDGDIISIIYSAIIGGIGGGDEETTSTRSTRTSSASTRSTSSSTTARTSSISTRSTSSSTSTLAVVTPPPTPSTRSTLTVTETQSVDPGANNASTVNSSKSNSGLPSVVIGVIVAAAVIFGLIFIALIARKIFQARRRRRRATWAENTGISPFQDPNIREKALPPPPPAETQEYPSYPAYPPAAVTFANNNPAPYSPAAASSAGYPAPYPFGGAGNATTAAQGNTTMFKSSAFTPADLAGPVVIQQTPPTPIATSTTSAQLSVVKRTFMPSLPDELSIATGEQVRVLSMYDDGWALCVKVSTGDQGVVPQECLEPMQGGGSNTPAQQLASSEESTRLNRNSSLRRNKEQTY